MTHLLEYFSALLPIRTWTSLSWSWISNGPVSSDTTTFSLNPWMCELSLFKFFVWKLKTSASYLVNIQTLYNFSYLFLGCGILLLQLTHMKKSSSQEISFLHWVHMKNIHGSTSYTYLMFACTITMACYVNICVRDSNQHKMKKIDWYNFRLNIPRCIPSSNPWLLEFMYFCYLPFLFLKYLLRELWCWCPANIPIPL